MAQMQNFLFEIGTEEMPSAPLINAATQLSKLMTQGLNEAGLSYGDIRIITSPRRLAIVVHNLAMATEEIHDIKRGPASTVAFDADGNPTKAAAGFARKFGIAVDQLVRRVDTDGREYVFAEINIASRPALPILTELCHDLIGNIEWPNYRSQRWGCVHESFVRPIRWICALLGSEIVPVTYGDVTSSNTTRGHRVLSDGCYTVTSPDVYETVLEEAHVLSAEARIKVIREQIAQVEAARPGSHVDTPKRTFDEVVNLCEWPTVMVGTFDEEFLAVPHEIICESMLSNQRYFPIYDAQGKLTREFVIVSNGDPACEATIVNGNERVVRARLDDAKFFYEEDLKVSMDNFVQRLDRVVFQEKLGTVLQKVQRIEAIARGAAQAIKLDETQITDVVRAAHLAKADLVSQAVIEFTSQQGVMGGYYATAAGENPKVAVAVAQHYRPRFAGDVLPENLYGKLVALADKLDTVAALFAINEPPTGSSDPFAVRRAAIGIIAILRELPAMDLRALITCALDALANQGLSFDVDRVATDIGNFFAGRLATIARDEGAKADTIEAVSAVQIIDPQEFLSRVAALDQARATQPEIFQALAGAFARASHLADASLGNEVDASILNEPEQQLLHSVVSGEKNVGEAMESGDFAAALRALAQLKEPIDRFFDEVMVMDKDDTVRCNRLRLLNRFCSIFADVANIGALARKN
ncbi:glycine--tRNA ligase subunit beta [Atopobium fossor]|uniref:glycine--tRNA ligase subunit beta n=1 Tax=Atopobium fossor TaxID=39487 RepID=UPI00042100C6|nr:glycine--tRNA ligase subunit beta [Atopobium fossor]